MTDPIFKNINRLFVQSLNVGNNEPTRNYFDQTVKRKQKAYEILSKFQETIIAQQGVY